MPIEFTRIEGLQNAPINVHLAKNRPAPPTMPNKPFLGVICGSRGSGKSSAMINLVKLYAPYKHFDHVVLLSPTYNNDVKLGVLAQDKRYEFEVITDVNPNVISEIIDTIKGRIEGYKAHLEYKKVWDKFLKAPDVGRLAPDDLMMLYRNNFQEPVTPYENGMPTHLIIFDDLVGEGSVYRNRELDKFLLQHRHYLTSLLFCVQIWKNCIPRGIRTNLSFICLFSQKNNAYKKEVADELSAYVSPEKLIELWDWATEEPHNFLCINVDDRKHMFRRNFNDIIKLESLRK